MKKFFGGMIILLLVPIISLASEFRFSETPSVGLGERISNDVYIGGGSVVSAGVITGDILAGGGTVVISGSVGGDLMAGGGSVSILSSVGDDLRVGGGTVVIQGRVSGDVVAGGGQVTIGGPGIGGDATLGGGVIRIDAPVSGDMRIGGGSVYLNAPVTGNVIIKADELTLGSRTIINGNLTYKSSKELTKETGAIVRGETVFEEREKIQVPAAALSAILPVFIAVKFLSLLVCSLIVGLIFRRYSKVAVEKVVERPLLELGRGLLTFTAMPVISILALVTIVGIPIGILGLIGFVVILVFSWIVASIITGSVVYRYFSKGDLEISWKTILTGAVVYSVIGFVPIIGWVAQCLLTLLSLGAITAIKLEVIKQWR